LCKAVQVHAQEYSQINFFEWASIWPEGEVTTQEQSNLAGIFVDQKQSIDFYAMKQKFEKLAQLLNVSFEWVKADGKVLAPWYLPYQTAYLMCDGVKIGVAGKVNPAFFAKITIGDAFVFELDGNFLLSHKVPLKRYIAASKYPSVSRDVSMLVPLVLTVSELRRTLQKLDTKIIAVDLVDFFEKPEWKDQKSVTFRVTLSDPAATMTTAHVDEIMSTVITYLQKQGAIIR
jgi:phenylalanyl-tRNA synthetase beta chain